MRKLAQALLGGAALLGLGAGIAAAAELRVVVATYSPATKPIFEGMAKDFMAANPDTTVKVEEVAWDNLQQRLTTDIAGGTAPDIAMIGTRWLVDFVKNDIAEPLNAYMDDEFKGRFIESFMSPSTIDASPTDTRTPVPGSSSMIVPVASDRPSTWPSLG